MNYIMMFIEITSILWTIIGTIEINALPSLSGSNAMMDCLRDYSVNTVLMSFVFLLVGWAQLLRFGVVVVCLVYH